MGKCVCEELKGEEEFVNFDHEDVEVFGHIYGVYVGVDDAGMLFVGVGDWATKGKPINFCPLCGRKLREE